MHKDILKLKQLLEERLADEDRKISSAENYSTKIVSMLGDVCKRYIDLEKRVEKLEKEKNARTKA